MKINKNWEPTIIKCIHCNKDFEVKFEFGTDDNCLPVINSYNFDRIFYGHVDEDTWTDEDLLQWLNIVQILFWCPHCRTSFGSTCNCSVCRKPIYHWMGSPSGVTCSDKCYNIYRKWIEKSKKSKHGGVIPREVVFDVNNEYSNERLKETARISRINKWGLK